MPASRRSRVAAYAAALGASVLLAACGSAATSSSSSRARVGARPRTLPLPAGVIAASTPQLNGYLWVLSGTVRARAVAQFSLSTGQRQALEPVSADASAVAESSTGTLALGLATPGAGAVQLLGADGRGRATIAVGAPVRALAFGSDGSTLYVLDGNRSSASVTVIDTVKRRVRALIGVPRDAVSIAPTPDQSAVWSAQASGGVTETSLRTRRVLTQLSVGSPAISLALAPTGATLYVLKGTSLTANIAVIDTATSSMRRVLPAASDSVAVQVSPNGGSLYDFVGAPSYGNVQIIGL